MVALRWEMAENGARLGFDGRRHVAEVQQEWAHAERRWVWVARYWGDRRAGAGPPRARDRAVVGRFWDAAEAVAAVEIRAGESTR